MKKYTALLLLVAGLFAFSSTYANQTITNNKNCDYVATVLFAPLGLCTGSTVSTVIVPAGATVTVPCPPGQVSVAVLVREINPGINLPVLIGDPFCGFSAGINGYGNCGASLLFTPGGATNFLSIC